MTLKYFAKMLNPEAKIVIYAEDGDAVGCVRAKNVEGYRFEEETVKDWKMNSFKPVVKVTI